MYKHMQHLNLIIFHRLAVRSKASVCVRSFAGTAGSNPAYCTDVSHVSVVCCQVSANGRSLIQGSVTKCVCACVRACVCDQVQQWPSIHWQKKKNSEILRRREPAFVFVQFELKWQRSSSSSSSNKCRPST
jgi:hypothetical protein